MPQVVQAIYAVGQWIYAGLTATGAYGAVFRAVATIVLSAATARLVNRGVAPISSFSGLQQTTRSALEYKKIVYGEALVSGPIFYSNARNPSNQDFHLGVAFTGHEVDSFVGFYIDSEYVPVANIDGGTGAISNPEFIGDDSVNAAYMQFHEGTDTQAADSFLSAFSDWTSAHQLRGISYASYIFRYVQQTQEVWEKGVPQRLAALVRGRKVYDPRLDSTNGGSGLQRYTDASTWAWSDNPSLCLADYLVSYMDALPADDIDWPSVIAAADACDVLVDIPDGLGGSTTQKRFTCNGAITEGDSHTDNIEALLSSFDGLLSWSAGVWSIRASVWTAPTETIDESVFSGTEVIRGHAPASERYNVVTGFYVDPSRDYQPVEFQPATSSEFLTRDNDQELRFDLQLPFTNNEYMAQRIAYRRLEQFDNQVVTTLPLNLQGLKFKSGTTYNLNFDKYGWINKSFRVIKWRPLENGGYEITSTEDSASRYADPAVGDYSTKDSAGIVVPPTQDVPAPSGLTAVNVDSGIRLDWTNPAGRLFEYVDVYASVDDQWTNAVKIGETKSNFFVYTNAVGRSYFWVRARNFESRSSDRFPDSDTSTITAVGNLTYVTGSITDDPFMYAINGVGTGNWITTGNNSVSHQLTEGLGGTKPAKRFPSSSVLSGDAILNQLFNDASDELIECPDGTVLEYEIRMKSSAAGLPIRVGFDVYDSTDTKVEDDNEGQQTGLFQNTVADTYQTFIGRYIIDADALGGTAPYYLAVALKRDYVGDDETIDVDMFRNARLTEFDGALKSGLVPPVDGAVAPNDGKFLGDAGWGYIHPKTDAETTALVDPSDFMFPPGDVRRYGAKGDAGTTDNATAINNAISVVNAAGGGDVVIPDDGVYQASSAINLKAYARLCGQGSGSHLEMNGAALELDGVAEGSHLTQFTISNLQLSRIGTAGPALLFNGGSQADDVIRFLVDRLDITGSTGDGIVMRSTYIGDFISPLVRGCTLNGIVMENDIPTNDTAVNGVAFHGGEIQSNTLSGITMDECNSVQFFGTIIEGNGAYGVDILRRCTDINFFGCYWEENDEYDVRIGSLATNPRESQGIHFWGGSIRDGSAGKDHAIEIINSSGFSVDGTYFNGYGVSPVKNSQLSNGAVDGYVRAIIETNSNPWIDVPNQFIYPIYDGIAQRDLLTDSGAISLMTKDTLLVTTAASTLTLADGFESQDKYITMVTDGGDAVLTPTSLRGATTITFDDVGDSVHLRFLSSNWTVIAASATVA